MGFVQACSAHGDLWWRNFVSFSGKLRWAGRYKREREEEMRKQKGGGDKSS
jgi:hypothetical protein